MPKRNYGYEKRQKELKRQQKKEEKNLRKLERAKSATEEPAEGAVPADDDEHTGDSDRDSVA